MKRRRDSKNATKTPPKNMKEGSKRGIEGQNSCKTYRKQLTKWQILFISVIILNVSGVNAPITRLRVGALIKKQDPIILDNLIYL